MTVGGVAAFAIAAALHLPEAMWSVVTALIVTRAERSRALHAGRDRLLGTLYGVAIALAGVLLRRGGVPDGVVLALCLAAASAPIAWRPALAAAPVAAVIVLSSNGNAPLAVALLRIGEIVIGAVVGTAASRLLTPRLLPWRSAPPLSGTG